MALQSPLAHSITPRAFVDDTGFPDVRELDSLHDISRLLQEVVGHERTVNAELEELLSKRGALESTIISLHGSTVDMLQSVKADAEGLAAGVSETSDLSERVSSKVRQLDTTQSHVQQTLSVITVIIDRSNCIYGVRQALDSGDFEAAAGFVDTFMELDDKYGPVTDADGQQAAEQEQVLREAKLKLGGTVREKLRDAMDKRNHEDVIRFTRLYRPLRMKDEGLGEYRTYVVQLCTEGAETTYSKLVDGDDGDQNDYVTAATTIFRDVAVTMEENEEFVKTAFGTEALLDVVFELHNVCNTVGARVLQRYAAVKQLQRLSRSVSQKAAAGGGYIPRQASEDPREVEATLEQLLQLASSGEEYSQWVLSKMALLCEPAPLPAARHNAFRSSGFSVAVRELLNYYVALEEFVMEEDVSKALSIREHLPGSLTTSMVDDVFFVISRCSRRSLSAGSAACVAAVVGHANELLASSVAAVLRASLEQVAAKLVQGDPNSEGGFPAAATTAAAQAAYINDADTTSWYVTKLRQELEEGAVAYFSKASDQEQARSVMADLTKTSSDFAAIASWALAAVSGALASQLRPAVDAIARISYEGNESDDAGRAWLTNLAAQLDARIVSLQPLLTPRNYDSLVSLILSDIAKRVDAVVATKRFSQVGGLQLDRDVRALVAYAGDLTNRPVRDKFAELTQKATLLSLEAVEEAAEYWSADSAGSLGWHLSSADVRHVLRQRVDFAPEDIAGLAL